METSGGGIDRPGRGLGCRIKAGCTTAGVKFSGQGRGCWWYSQPSMGQIYGIKPTNLPSHCNVCGVSFSICHALECKKGGLITARHNKLHDGVNDLAGKAFIPAHM